MRRRSPAACLFVEFFNPGGGSIGLFQLPFVGSNPPPASFGFADSGGLATIGGFSIGTNDFGRVSIDDVRYSSVPEPGTLSLFGIGLLGFARILKRRS